MEGGDGHPAQQQPQGEVMFVASTCAVKVLQYFVPPVVAAQQSIHSTFFFLFFFPFFTCFLLEKPYILIDQVMSH